jgi:transcriptional regulator with XRE-family HTH domain
MTLEEIRAALSDRNLAEIGRRLKVTRAYLSAVRKGKAIPSREMQARLSDYLVTNNGV